MDVCNQLKPSSTSKTSQRIENTKSGGAQNKKKLGVKLGSVAVWTTCGIGNIILITHALIHPDMT